MWPEHLNIAPCRVFSATSKCSISHSKGERLTSRKRQQKLYQQLDWCTYPCQQVGGSWRPAGWCTDWQKCALWACQAVEKELCFNLLASLHVFAGYLILISSLNETYRSDLGPDVTVALHKVLVAVLKQFQHLGNANANRAWRKGNDQHCSLIFIQWPKHLGYLYCS